MSKEEAEQAITAFLQVIIDASDYLFSLNHSEPYSYEGYACGWLRYHYPLQFLTCSLNINKDNAEKTQALTQYAASQGIPILPPKFRRSLGDYSFDIEGHAIYKGIASITHMSNKVSQELYNLRDNHYEDFIDVLEDMSANTSIDTRQIKILISLNFFSEFGGINDLLDIESKWEEWRKKKTIKRDSDATKLFTRDLIVKHAGKITDKQYSSVDMIGLLKDWILNRESIPTSIFEQMDYENEYLGYVCTVSKNAKPEYYYVCNVEGYNKNILTLYQICDGTTEKIKIDKHYTVKVGDVIHVLEYTEVNKWRKTGEDPITHKPKFEKSEEKETIISKIAPVSRLNS